MKTKFFTVMLLMCSAFAFISCSTDDSTDTDTSPVVVPDTPTPSIDIRPEAGFDNLTEEDMDNYAGDLVTRLLFMLYDPDADYNDIQLIDHYLNGLAYAQSLSTNRAASRGIWGQAKAVYDFAKVVKDANTLHRTTLIGAMATWGYSDKESRDEIWRDIRESGCLPSKYNSLSADEFWKEFSLGNLDSYAQDVYNAVMACSGEIGADRNRTGDLAATMAYNHLRHIDMTMAVAPKLIEAGANIVFAFGDDLIQNSKLAYDFVNTNGEVVLQSAQGNLTAEAFMDACNNNLKLLTNGLKEVVPTTQDLTQLLSDLTTEQIKALNKEIDEAIKRAGDQQITKEEIAMFVENATEIIKPSSWTMNFADVVYEAKDGTTFEIQSESGGAENKKSYKFIYCDKYENVLLEAKCAVKKDYITIRVDYFDEGCDLLPSGTTMGDIIPIPYLGGGGDTTPTNIILWWDSNLHTFKSFNIKKEDTFTSMFFTCNLTVSDEAGFASLKYKQSLCFNSDEMVVSKQNNTYTLTAEREIDNVHYTIKMQFNDEGLNSNGQPKMSNIISMEYYRIPLGEKATLDWSWHHVSFTLSNLRYLYYVDNSKNSNTSDDDIYVMWQGAGGYTYNNFTMDDFYGDFWYGGESSSTEFYFHGDDTGTVQVQVFYKCDDLEKYMQ